MVPANNSRVKGDSLTEVLVSFPNWFFANAVSLGTSWKRCAPACVKSLIPVQKMSNPKSKNRVLGPLKFSWVCHSIKEAAAFRPTHAQPGTEMPRENKSTSK